MIYGLNTNRLRLSIVHRLYSACDSSSLFFPLAGIKSGVACVYDSLCTARRLVRGYYTLFILPLKLIPETCTWVGHCPIKSRLLIPQDLVV